MGVFSGTSKKAIEFFGKPMGTPNPENLESDFDRRMTVIFPTQSPVNSLAGPPEETKTPPEEGFIPKFSGKFMKKLLESRKDLNNVYSEGYFQNHYPEADKNLKQFLHEKTMASWAKALREREEHEEPDGDEAPSFTIVVNINK